MNKRIVSLVAGLQLFLFSISANAQAPQSWTSAEMYQAIQKLNVLGSVLYVAAHPDDENTRLITYLSKDKLYRTGYLSMTRGDGGQNLIGNEQGVELGLIRTQELLAARRMDGGEQFFTRAYDFGFSKNPEETFTKWDKEKILSDVVWVIRKFQPDVIITRFPTTGEGGHGHHTASAILANEAFAAAADPNRFPEQLQFVKPWQAQRVVFNSFNFGGTNTTSGDQLRVDVGGYNPLLGKSYGEIAAESRSNHKSQGFGATATRGESFESFKTTSGVAPVKDLMDGVDPDWSRVKGAEGISEKVNRIAQDFDLSHPEKSVQSLVQLHQSIKKLPGGYWRDQKLKEVVALIEQCSGLFLDITTSTQFAVQTDSVRFNFSFNNRLGADATLRRVQMDDFDTSFTVRMDKNRNLNFSKFIYVPVTKPITQPYWLENKMSEGYFNIRNPQQIGQPDIDPAYNVTVSIQMYGETFDFQKQVKYKFTDPVRGELYEPLVVVPPVVIHPDRDVMVFMDKNERPIELSIRAFKPTNLSTPSFTSAVNSNAIQVGEGSFERGQLKVFTKQIKPAQDNTDFTLFAGNPADSLFRDKHEIKYDHIPYINYYTRALFKLRNIELKTYNKKIGYIIGAGDKVPEALEQMGYEVTLLTEKELSRNSLQQFDAIIAGVRAYNTNEWMNNYYDRLMKYVNDGGNLIVQYNTSSNIGPVRAKMGPYNFNISRTRVTDENATVRILKPDHPVLNFPNKINNEDFKGWIQERSIYHGTDWDSNFESIFSMNDPGEMPDEGSLLIAKYGKGYFSYTGLVFFRELPAGVPGAYRLLANIIALNKKKAF